MTLLASTYERSDASKQRVHARHDIRGMLRVSYYLVVAGRVVRRGHPAFVMDGIGHGHQVLQQVLEAYEQRGDDARPRMQACLTLTNQRLL